MLRLPGGQRAARAHAGGHAGWRHRPRRRATTSSSVGRVGAGGRSAGAGRSSAPPRARRALSGGRHQVAAGRRGEGPRRAPRGPLRACPPSRRFPGRCPVETLIPCSRSRRRWRSLAVPAKNRPRRKMRGRGAAGRVQLAGGGAHGPRLPAGARRDARGLPLIRRTTATGTASRCRRTPTRARCIHVSGGYAVPNTAVNFSVNLLREDGQQSLARRSRPARAGGAPAQWTSCCPSPSRTRGWSCSSATTR